VSRYQKGETNLDFTEARDSEWQWHQLSHMQVCTLLQTDNYASNPPLSFYGPDALPVAQPTASKHCRQNYDYVVNTVQMIFSFNIGCSMQKCHNFCVSSFGFSEMLVLSDDVGT